jgi:hypothetical protein
MTIPVRPELPPYGLHVRLATHRHCNCGDDIAVVGRGRDSYAAELTCARCGSHRAWLSYETAKWITTVISKFGAPTTPIILRKR